MIRNPFAILEPFQDKLRVIIFQREDDPITDENIRDTLKATGVVRTIQVHGNRTIVAKEALEHREDADGTATDVSGLAITTYWADCQNLLVYAPKHHVVGVIHAGWKGLLSCAIPEHFALLKNEWGITPQETFVCSGPSLCQSCSEFSDPASELPGIDPKFFDGRHVDLRGIADTQLTNIGVPPQQQERMNICTRCNSDMYWSYRNGDENKRNLLACCLK